MGSRAKRFVRLSALLCATSCLSGVAMAQQAPVPAENYEFDARNVDVLSGKLVVTSPSISIGAPEQGGLSYSRAHTDKQWRDTPLGTISASGSTYYVTIDNKTFVFSKSSGVYTSKGSDGNQLTSSGTTFTFTSSQGAVAVFNTTYATGNTNYFGANQAVMTSLTQSNGVRLEYNYLISGGLGRLQSVTSNTGYQLHFDYQTDATASGIASWGQLLKVTAFNQAVDYCAPLATTCSFTQTWPSLWFEQQLSSTLTGVNITDQSGRTTAYGYLSSGEISTIRYPGSTADDVTVTYDGYRVSTVTDATGVWTYGSLTFEDQSLILAVVTNANNDTVYYAGNSNTLRLTSVTENFWDSHVYYYDSYGRTIQAVNPEGDYTSFTYDARGNVTQTTYTPKAGSGLSPITTSATYPTTCVYVASCNKPTSTTDALGKVTDYTYDTTTGAVLTETAPAGVNGVRPQTRYSYGWFFARYNISGSGLADAVYGVSKLAATSSCATGSSCAGTADEVKQTFAYGTSGVANNLLPTSLGRGSGDGALWATSTLTYDNVGNVLTVDGPLSGTGDTTRFVYDAARQRVGVIGPDPDGSGALLNRAVRTTYDAAGRITQVEEGSTTGLSDANWASFVSLRSKVTTFDSWGRPIKETASAGGVAYSLSQVSYDAIGRVSCMAARMNPSVFTSLPASACDQGVEGANGADRITRNTYDVVDQVIQVTTGVGTANARNEYFAYTANGMRSQAQDAAGNITTYTYDGFDRLVQVNYPNASGGGTSTTDYEQFTYDAGAQVIQQRLRDGQVIGYAYDASGNTIAKDLPSTWADSTYAYDNFGRVSSAAYTGYTLSYGYDALGRNTSQSSPQGALSYQYDLAGNRTRITWPDGFYATYEYDLTGAMTAIKENGSTSLTAYGYDGLGRRTVLSRGDGAVTGYGYDGASRLIAMAHDLTGTSQDLSYSWTYNAAGQITARSASNDAYALAAGTSLTRAYGVNGLNQVTTAGGLSLSYDGRGNLASDGATGFGYNPDDLLVNTSAGATLSYDPAGRLYASSYGGTTTQFLYDGDQVVGEYSGGSLLRRYVPGPGIDEPATWYEGSGTGDKRWYAADERGSVIAVLNGAGAAIAINTYDEYGAPGAGNLGRYQYTGQTWLPEAGVYNYKARAYSPSLGRFMQTDPAGYEDGLNWYIYAGADPVNYTDPTGEFLFAFLAAAVSSFASSTTVAEVFVTAAHAITTSTLVSWAAMATTGAVLLGTSPTLAKAGDAAKTDKACNNKNAVDFAKRNQAAAATAAGELGVPMEYVLGLSAHESGWGANRFAATGNNFFSLHGGAGAPYANGWMPAGNGTPMSTFPSYLASARSFAAQYGRDVRNARDVQSFVAGLKKRFNRGIPPYGDANFGSKVTNTIDMAKRRARC